MSYKVCHTHKKLKMKKLKKKLLIYWWRPQQNTSAAADDVPSNTRNTSFRMNVLISSKAAVSPCKKKWKGNKGGGERKQTSAQHDLQIKKCSYKMAAIHVLFMLRMLEFSEIKGWMTHNGVITISPQSILLFVITALHRRRLEFWRTSRRKTNCFLPIRNIPFTVQGHSVKRSEGPATLCASGCKRSILTSLTWTLVEGWKEMG